MEFTLAERNIALPAYFAARFFSGARTDFWLAGAFWGIARRCHAQPLSARPILCGAATLAVFAGAKELEDGPKGPELPCRPDF